MTGLVAVVAVLAVYRITLLVTADTLTQPWRDQIIDRYVHPVHELTVLPRQEPTDDEWPYSASCRCGNHWVGDTWGDVMGEANAHVNQHRGEMTTGPRWLVLLDCVWCASVHVAVPVCWSAWAWGDRGWWFVPASVLAASAVSGFLATFASPGH